MYRKIQIQSHYFRTTKPNKGKLRGEKSKNKKVAKVVKTPPPKRKQYFPNPPLANPHTGAFLYYRVLMPMPNCSVQQRKKKKRKRDARKS